MSTSRAPSPCQSDVDGELVRFFRGLGYTVTWDFDKQHTEYWHELYDGEGLVCQVDFGVPLAHFLEDLPLLAEGRHGTSATAYTVNCSDVARLRELARRARTT
jgi:hypothetical protein